MKTLQLIGRLWRDKVNGNTYHTTEIIVDGVSVHKTPFDYGYGDSYIQSAVVWLNKTRKLRMQKHASGSYTPLWRHCQNRRIALTTSVIKVKRRKDT